MKRRGSTGDINYADRNNQSMMRLSQMNANTVSNQRNGLNKDLLAFLKPVGSQGNIDFED